MAPPAGANGIIPVTALQKNSPAAAPRGPKAQAARLKLVLRRLPPGLTKSEFDALLGDEWKLGGGKVDWLSYKKGKISKDAAKPSIPSRAYFNVTQQAYVAALGDHVREITFHDAAKSFQDSALVGPPVLEYAPYTKIPGGRRRNDARQGTIDQDPEFKEFLESLTAPITKPTALEADTQKEEKVKTTPLIEALREKKANKDKPQGKNKSRGDAKESATEKKVLAKSGKDSTPAGGEKTRNLSKAEKDRAQKEAVKALNKEAASRGGASSSSADKTTTPAPERKRGNISVAKSMLQRDLGLAPATNKRRGTKREVNPVTQEVTPTADENTPHKTKGKEPSTTSTTSPATTSEKSAPTSTRKERPSRAERRAFKASMAEKANSKAGAEDTKSPAKPAASTPTILKKPQTTQNQASGTPKGPVAARPPPTEPSAARNAPSTPQTVPARPANPTPAHASQAASAPTATGKQAFLKHANASQGITEALIEEALKAFGAIDKVEIDKRKGFAYVDFAEPEGLVKAIAASPVKVAQGAVQILERKEKVPRNRPFTTGPPTGPVARGRGGFASRGRGGRGGARGVVAGAPDGGSPAVPASAPAVSAGGDAAT